MLTIENGVSLTPGAANAYKLIIFDIYFTNQWNDDVISFYYDN